MKRKKIKNNCLNCSMQYICPQSRGVVVWKNCEKFRPYFDPLEKKEEPDETAVRQ